MSHVPPINPELRQQNLPKTSCCDVKKAVLITTLVLSTLALVVAVVAYIASTQFLPHALSNFDLLGKVGPIGSSIWMGYAGITTISLIYLTIRTYLHNSIAPQIQYIQQERDSEMQQVVPSLDNLLQSINGMEIVKCIKGGLLTGEGWNYVKPEHIPHLDNETLDEYFIALFAERQDPLSISRWQALTNSQVKHLLENHYDLSAPYFTHFTPEQVAHIDFEIIRHNDLSNVLNGPEKFGMMGHEDIKAMLLDQNDRHGDWITHIPEEVVQGLSAEEVRKLGSGVFDALFNVERHVQLVNMDIIRILLSKEEKGKWLKHLTVEQIREIRVGDGLTHEDLWMIFQYPNSDDAKIKFAAIHHEVVNHLLMQAPQEGNQFNWGLLLSPDQCRHLFVHDGQILNHFPTHVLGAILPLWEGTSEIYTQFNEVQLAFIFTTAQFEGASLKYFPIEKIKEIPTLTPRQAELLFPMDDPNSATRFAELAPEAVNSLIASREDLPQLALLTRNHIENLKTDNITKEQMNRIFPVGNKDRLKWLEFSEKSRVYQNPAVVGVWAQNLTSSEINLLGRIEENETTTPQGSPQKTKPEES